MKHLSNQVRTKDLEIHASPHMSHASPNKINRQTFYEQSDLIKNSPFNGKNRKAAYIHSKNQSPV